MSWAFETQAPMGKLLMVRRHRLHNGLTLLSVQDASAPIVSYQTWFSVGSRNESKGATGLAHLFEHLMFNQTKTMALGEFDRQIESRGGDSNAATWADWTYYCNNLPADDLAMIAKMESQRMTELVLEPAVVEAEREVVINERLERVDEDIDGFASEKLFAHAFTSHPYHNPTIGWMQDIKGLSIPQIKEFYRQYYSPNRATIVVVGDFQEPELLAVIENHYGSIPRAQPLATTIPDEPKQSQERRYTYTKEVSAPRLLHGYKGPAQAHPDWAAVMFTCHLLAGSASSPLHRKLVIEEEIASSVLCDVMPFADPSLIEIVVTATHKAGLDAIETVIDDTIAAFVLEAPTDSEVQKVRNLIETEFWTGLSSMDGKAEALGHYQCVHNDFRMLFSVAERLATIDAQEVQRCLATYFKPSARTVIQISPHAAPHEPESQAQ